MYRLEEIRFLLLRSGGNNSYGTMGSPWTKKTFCFVDPPFSLSHVCDPFLFYNGRLFGGGGMPTASPLTGTTEADLAATVFLLPSKHTELQRMCILYYGGELP